MSEKKWFKDVWAGVIPIRYKTVRLTSAEILALYTTPKTLLDAPGAGKAIEFLSAVLFLDYGTADYAAYGILTVKTTTTATALSGAIAATTLVQASADTYVVVQALSAEAVLSVNEGLKLTCDTGNPTTGDSTIVVHLAYRIHDFN